MNSTGGPAVGFLQGPLVINKPSDVPAMESLTPTPDMRRIPAEPGFFVGRSEELARLEAAVAGAGGRAVVVAVHGLGGVGKSSLAARFAELHTDRFSPVWWATADSQSAIQSGISELAVALAPGTAALPSEQRVELGVQWLATHDDWLLILDNVTNPQDVAWLLGRVRTGTVVITSRQRSGWRTVQTVPLDVLPENEALDLLTQIVRSEWPEAELAGADQLCAELGWLPLAVEQAAAYLAQTRTGPLAYLESLARFPARTFAATAEGGDAQRTMARVWHITLDRLADTPNAGRVLRQLAWYASNDIPRSLLIGDVGERELSEALGRLAAYSMIALTEDTVSVHRVVQAVTRTPDPTDPHRQPADIAAARDTAAAALAAALEGRHPHYPTNWAAYRMVLPHARSLVERTTPDTDTARTSKLLDHLAGYLSGQGDVSAALAYSIRATEGFQRREGLRDLDTLCSQSNLASIYREIGDLESAIALFEVTLVDQEHLLGLYHPDVLSTRGNLASACRAAGDLARAIALFEATLAAQKRLLGFHHPDALITQGNLAGAYRETGHLDRAIALYEAVVTGSERTLGLDHPYTLLSRGNLASVRQDTGDLSQAISQFEVVLADSEHTLGHDHPNTLGARNNLAGALQAAGEILRAMTLFEGVLADRERVLGADHPETLRSLNNLAGAFRELGDPDRALPLFERTLAGRNRVLGSEHPETLSSQSNLACAYRDVGDLDRVIPLLAAVLAGNERVLGREHPNTLTSRNNLADVYREIGDLDRAIPLLEAALADNERLLGPDHPSMLISRNNLAVTYRDAGDLNRAIPLLEATLTDSERVLGHEHPMTKHFRSNLASLRD